MTLREGQRFAYPTDQYNMPSNDVLSKFPGKGDYIRFTGENGYPEQQKFARETFYVGQVLQVVSCEIGGSSSTVTVRENSFSWNSVLFEIVKVKRSKPRN